MPDTHRYLIALGSNMRHAQIGPPRDVLDAAVEVLGDIGLLIESVSPTIITPPMGPSQRRFANAALVAQSFREPASMLGLLQATEAVFGRQRRGQRWRARVLDLDIILWSGGAWASHGLTIPHPAFRTRDFVLRPAGAIAGGWRDPISGLTLRQLSARLAKALP